MTCRYPKGQRHRVYQAWTLQDDVRPAATLPPRAPLSFQGVPWLAVYLVGLVVFSIWWWWP